MKEKEKNQKGSDVRKISEEVVVVTRKDAPFAPDEQLGEYHLRRWNFRAKQMAGQKATVHIDRKRGIVSFDTAVYYTWMIHLTVVKAPLELAPEVIDNLDPDVGDLLQTGCLRVNTITGAEKKDFLGLLNPTKDTRGLISIGVAGVLDNSQKGEGSTTNQES